MIPKNAIKERIDLLEKEILNLDFKSPDDVSRILIKKYQREALEWCLTRDQQGLELILAENVGHILDDKVIGMDGIFTMMRWFTINAQIKEVIETK